MGLLSFLRRLRTTPVSSATPPARRYRGAIPVIEFDKSQVTRPILRIAKRVVDECDEIPRKYQRKVKSIACELVYSGGNLAMFCNAVEGIGIPDLPRYKIAEIARFVWHRSLAAMNRERQRKSGITEGIWTYSGAPCQGADGMDLGHEQLSGRRYFIAEGILFNGRQTWPSHERGCKCFTRPIIPGLHDRQ